MKTLTIDQKEQALRDINFFIGELTDDVDFTKNETKTIEEKAKYTPTAMPNVAPSKDDVLDTVTGDIIAPSSEPQAPFGGGASDSWESLL